MCRATWSERKEPSQPLLYRFKKKQTVKEKEILMVKQGKEITVIIQII